MRVLIFKCVVLAVAAFSAVGCDDGGSSANAPPRREQTVFGSGTIQGVVKFTGSIPERAEIPNKPCHADAEPLKDETVVVNDNRTLANVFVYLEDAPASNGSTREPALLDQVNCRYTPHVVGVQVDQPLRVASSDPTLHNVHYNPQRNEPANFGMNGPSEKRVTFARPEFIRVKCDVHPWMTSYIGVFDSPFFAVSSQGEGGWKIEKVPAGKYTLVAWHEQFGEMRQPVEVKENEAIEAAFEYKAPERTADVRDWTRVRQPSSSRPAA